MAKILLLNGPNLNLLGSRQPEIYGKHTLNDIEQLLLKQANDLGHTLESFQSNAEHQLIDKIHDAKINVIDFVLINPAAYTHTSIAIRDAFLSTELPFIEIHLSDIHEREEFRQHSYFSDIAVTTFMGLGINSYTEALKAADKFLND